MTEKQPIETAPKKARNIFEDVRNGAIVLAALAVTFKMLMPEPAPVQPSVSQSAAVSTVAEAGKVAASPEPKMVEMAKVTEKMLARAAIIEHGPNMVLKTRVDGSPSVKAADALQTYSQPQESPVPPIHSVSAPAQPPIAAAEQSAAQVVTRPNVAPQVNSQGSVRAMPKIGFNADGTPMSIDARTEQIKKALSAIPENYTVNWNAPNEKDVIYAFTDPTCPYCRKLHAAIPDLNAAGISVRYFLFPRDLPSSTAEKLSPTATTLLNVWCSLDQKEAMNEAYGGYKVRETSCDSLPADQKRLPAPIRDHYFFGMLFNVTGTPTIVSRSGKLVEGFSTTDALLAKLGY